MTPRPSRVIDSTDRKVLQALRDFPRGTVSDLADVVGISRATFRSRLERLWEEQIIIGLEPQLELARVGFHVQAWVELQVRQGELAQVKETLENTPSVIEAFSTTGRADVRCRIAGRSTAHLQEILLELTRSPHITKTESFVILGPLVTHRKVDSLDLLDLI